MNTTKRLNHLAKVVFSVVACASATASLATTKTTWNWNESSGSFVASGSTSAVNALTTNAWSTTGTGSTLQSACVHSYGGNAGIVNTSESNPCTGEPGTGPHAADNAGTVDLFMLSFASKVDLESVKIGWNGSDNQVWDESKKKWVYKDSDISVLAYTGPATTNAPVLAGKTLGGLGGLLASGWTLVGHYGNVGRNTNNTAAITANISSSWWLVSAYSSNYGSSVAEQYQTCKNSSGTNICNNSNDYFKLMSVAGNVTPPDNKVPEPGSLALAAAGLIGMLGLSRRRKAKE